MIRRVELSRRALKDLARVPRHVREKLQEWVEGVKQLGLEEMRKVRGYHDEPLKGPRTGQRSIRLSLAYRAIYVVTGDAVEFVRVEEVNKHAY